jgi:dTDP-4-amino-4,6-dideoxygalactose transaminase
MSGMTGPSDIIDAAAAMLTPGAFNGRGVFCVSFNWNKSISGGGGGAVITDDDYVAGVCGELKCHKGGDGASNYKMPALCAAEAFSQLADADNRRAHLQELSAAYDEELRRVGLESLPKGNTRWLTGTMLRDAEAVGVAMERIIKIGHVPRPAWPPLGDRASCPGAWEIRDRGIVLPGGYTITAENVKEICKALDGLQ